ncbi:MAG: RDD family protein [Candidatus Omnitrophota bacterium]
MKIYASFWKRLLAVCIDNTLSCVFLLTPIVFYYLNGERLTFVTGAISLLLVMIWPVFTLYNTVYLVGIHGASIGKKIMGVIVTNKRSSEPLGFWRAYLRQLSKKLSWIPLGGGYFWMLIDDNKQTWHDKIARSKVFILDAATQIPPAHKKKKASFIENHINSFAVLSIVFMLMMLFLLLYLSIKIVPLYQLALRFSNIGPSYYTQLAINVGLLIKKMYLFFVVSSPFYILFFALPKDKRLCIFLGISFGLVFLVAFLCIRSGIYHPHIFSLQEALLP